MNNPLLIFPLMLKARRPSRLTDMPAVRNAFWLKKGYVALTFFGTVLTHSQEEAERINSHYDELKNHEMIHLHQARATHDSWLCFYALYLWYWLKGLPYNRRMKNAAYLLNPFEMEAYRHMYDMSYLQRLPEGKADEWRRFAKMKMAERHRLFLAKNDDFEIIDG